MLEPAYWKLIPCIRHVLTAEHTEGEHLSRRQLRFELWIKVTTHWCREFVAIPLLHAVVYSDKLALLLFFFDFWFHRDNSACRKLLPRLARVMPQSFNRQIATLRTLAKVTQAASGKRHQAAIRSSR